MLAQPHIAPSGGACSLLDYIGKLLDDLITVFLIVNKDQNEITCCSQTFKSNLATIELLERNLST
jgi:hypothetical protein